MTIDEKKKRLATALKWGIGLVAAAIIGPLAYLAIKGIVGLAIALALGCALINFAPVVAMKFVNWKLKAIKHEAATSPVETMQAIYQEKEVALAGFLERIRTFSTEVRNFADKLDGFKAQFPNDSRKFESTLAAMKRLLAVREQKYRDAQSQLELFDGEIRKADAIWKMGLAAQAMTRAAGMTEDDFMQKLKTETAIDSVQTQLNRALADLDTALLEEVPTLEDKTNVVLTIPQAEKVRA